MGRDKVVLIIGAGPAGLTAAYELVKNTTDCKPIMIELYPQIGGLSKTVSYQDNLFELGPHRLFTKNSEVFDLWKGLLPMQGAPALDDKMLNRAHSPFEGDADPEKVDDVMLKRRRFSRIYYLKNFFDYPISINLKTILNLGVKRTMKIGLSYVKSVFVKRNEENLEDFMINRFGKVLYEMFFEHYTQKVWGLHPRDISKEWGEQRIKGLSLMKAIISAVTSLLNISKNKETSLIEEYYYPKFGCGQLWQKMADKIVEEGGEIHLKSKVVGVNLEENKITGLQVYDEDTCETHTYSGDVVISSMPIKDFVCGINSNIPKDVKSVAENLPYRDYMLVGLYVKDFKLKNNTDYPTVNNICPDSWIYMQEKDVVFGRIQVMNNWSPYVIKDFENKTFIGLEYFCDEGDKYWQMLDGEMIDFGISELENLGIIERKDVVDAVRYKVRKAYPAYFGAYENFEIVKKYLDGIENLYCIGRNGQHKYNNMDHSMLSGIEVARVLSGNLDKSVLWKVNTENEYHESKK